jgi:hypothetical protein
VFLALLSKFQTDPLPNTLKFKNVVMKKKPLLITGCFCLLFLFCSLFSLAQPTAVELPDDAGKPTKQITAKDKTAIFEIFKTLDPTRYRIYIGSEGMGTLAVPAPAWVLVKPGEYSISTKTMLGGYYASVGLFYAVTRPPGKGLEEVFGKTNAARFGALINKYTAGQ